MKFLKKVLPIFLSTVFIFGSIGVTTVSAAEPQLTLVTDAKFDEISRFSDGAIKFLNGDWSTWESDDGTKYYELKATSGGYIDENGKYILQVKNSHEYLDELSNASSIFSEGVKNGTNKAIDFEIKELRDFHERRAYIKLSEGHASIPQKGKDFADMVTHGEAEGFIDKNNKLIYDTYETMDRQNSIGIGRIYGLWSGTIGDYKEGVSVAYGAKATQNGDINDVKRGLIFLDPNGKLISKVYDETENGGYDRINSNFLFSEGLLGVGESVFGDEAEVFWDKSMGYIDKNGSTVIDNSKFLDATPFKDGMAYVRLQTSQKVGVIDKTGKYIIQPEYDGVIIDNNYDNKIFYEDRGSFRKNDKWGIIDKTGKVISDFIWDSADQFTNGMCMVKKGDKWGYIDLSGKVVIEPKYEDAGYFYNGMALVKSNGKYVLIDKTGKQIGTQSWNFEEISTEPDRPDLINYKQNGKWGLARLTGEVSNVSKNKSTFVVLGGYGGDAYQYYTPDGKLYYSCYEDTIGYAIQNETDKTDEVKMVLVSLLIKNPLGEGTNDKVALPYNVFDFNTTSEIEVIQLPKLTLKPGEIYYDYLHSGIDAELRMYDGHQDYLIKFDSDAEYAEFISKIPYKAYPGFKYSDVYLPLEDGIKWLKEVFVK